LPHAKARGQYADLEQAYLDAMETIQSTVDNVRNISRPRQCHITMITFTAKMSHDIHLGWNKQEMCNARHQIQMEYVLRARGFSPADIVTSLSSDPKVIVTTTHGRIAISAKDTKISNVSIYFEDNGNAETMGSKDLKQVNAIIDLVNDAFFRAGRRDALVEKVFHPQHIAFVDAMNALGLFRPTDGKKFSDTCITTRHVGCEGVSVKFFKEGSIQLAGCRHYTDLRIVLEDVATIFKMVLDTDSIVIEEIVPRLHSMTTIIDSAIALGNLQRELNDHNIFSHRIIKPLVVEDTMARKASIFETGSIIIMGCTMSDVAAMYKLVVEFIDNNVDVVTKERTAKMSTPKLAWTTLVRMIPGVTHSHLPTRRATVPGCLYCMRRGNVHAS